MDVDVSFPTFKALTALRKDENDSIDDVIRRLLDIPQRPAEIARCQTPETATGLFLGGVLFPNGSSFRASYKGVPHFASVVDGVWVGADGVKRNSPSEAASAISNTNVNGWRFWEVMFPASNEWRLLDRVRGR